MEKRTRKRWLLYGICSFIFLLLPILSSPDFSSDMHLFSVRGFQRSFISYVLLLVFFYAQMFVFLPKFYFRRKFLLFWIFMICCFIICSFVPIMLIPRNVLPAINNIGGPRHHGSFSFFSFWLSEFFPFPCISTRNGNRQSGQEWMLSWPT